jgi:hypothetical protein
MAFCGQCGYKLAPGDIRCPRCGSAIERDLVEEDPHLYDRTMVSPHLADVVPITPEPETPLPPGYPGAPAYPSQQKLILRTPERNPGIQTEAGSQATVRGHVPQGGDRYAAYPTVQPPAYGASLAGPAPTVKRRRRGTGLLVTLLILVLALGSATALISRPALLKALFGDKGQPPTIVSPAPTLTASDHARNLIQQYYADINKQDYRDAYNLWGSDFQHSTSYASFAAGYSHTSHVDVSIGQLTPVEDGTISATITILAQEVSANGPVTNTYAGKYVIGQENGAWKFLSGNFSRVGS